MPERDIPEENESRIDVQDLIIEGLSSGPKTPSELENYVSKKIQLSKRAHQRHVEKLIARKVVEEIAEKGESGRLIIKYALVTDSEEETAENEEPIEPTTNLLEIAAWINLEPNNWPPIKAVTKARILLKTHSQQIPTIAPSVEDPDSYVFVWPNNPYDIHPRFFRLKDIFQAMKPPWESDQPPDGTVFASCSRSSPSNPNETTFTVCIAISKEKTGTLRIIHVESNSGPTDKAWIKSVHKQYNAKSEIEITNNRPDEKTRTALTNLRNVLEKHELVIPSRYINLINELLNYSYNKPSKGYAQALAGAVTAALTQGKTQPDNLKTGS